METLKRKPLTSEKGFALVAAIIASLILLAIGMLVINLSTKDLRSSSATVGNNKSLAAVESGTHRLVQDFNPDSTTWTAANNYTTNCTATTPTYIWRTIASGVDAATQYAVCSPTTSNLPPVPIPGYALGSGGWGMMRYNSRIVGKSDSYNSSVSVDVGIGYGPVPMGTTSR
jgi:Tfp pilus assembly protein PilX